MSTTKRGPSRPRQPHAARDAVAIRELTRLLVAHGAAERHGSAPRDIRQLRDNVSKGVNRAVYTMVALLRQSGEARAFAAALVAELDPPESCPIEAELCAETDAIGELLPAAMRYEAGDHSTAVVAALMQQSGTLTLIAEQVRDDATALLYGTARAA